MRNAYFTASLVAIGLSIASVARADVIASPPQNFDSTTTGTVPTGWNSGTNLGTTTAGVGVGSSNGFKTTNALNLSYGTPLDLVTGSPTYDFSVAFNLIAPPTVGMIGVGIEDPSGAAASPYNQAQPADRTSVGIWSNGSTSGYEMGSEGYMNGYGANSFGSAFSLTSGDWYLFSGSLTYNSSTTSFQYTNLSLEDLGAAGTSTPGANLLPSNSQSHTVADNTANGSNIILTGGSDDAYFFVGSFTYTSGSALGVSTIDNVNEVPEPASLGLLARIFHANSGLAL